MNVNLNAKRYPASQRGFGLVELLIAMAIGLLIALGAERLFMIGIQNQQVTQRLSQRQAILSYVADSLVGDIRRATDVDITDDDDCEKVKLTMPDPDDPQKTYPYTYSCGGDPNSANGLSLYVEESGTRQPILNGFFDLKIEEACDDWNVPSCPYYQVTIAFANGSGQEKTFTLHVMNRQQAMNALNSQD